MHNSFKHYYIIITFFVIIIISSGCSDQVSFKKDVNPILSSNCMKCHDGGEGFKKSKFSVQSYDSIMKGTKFGPVIIPGSSASSTLYRMINHKVDPKIQMPPHHINALAEGRLAPLTPKQIETIKKWINQGARDN